MSNAVSENLSLPAEPVRPTPWAMAGRVAGVVLVAAALAAGGRWAARRIIRALRPVRTTCATPGRTATFTPTAMTGRLEVGEGADAPDVPRPQDAERRFCQRAKRAGAMMLQYESPDAPSDVAAYYRSVMPRLGWRESKRNSALARRHYDGILLFFKKNPARMCIIGMSEPANRAGTLTTVMVK